MDYYFISKLNEKIHMSRDIRILYQLKGSLEIHHEKKNSILNAGEFYIINMEECINCSVKINNLTFCLVISYEDLQDFTGYGKIYFRNEDSPNSEYYKAVKGVLDQFVDLCSDSNRYSKAEQHSLYYRLLYTLLNSFQVSLREFPLKGNDENDRTRQILDYLEKNYSKPISLEELSNTFYFSVSYMSKFFKTKFGTGFHEYLTALRLRHSVKDIIETDKPIIEIAFDNGFHSTSTFSKLFRGKYQMSPTEYRRTVCINDDFSKDAEESVLNADSDLDQGSKEQRLEEAVLSADAKEKKEYKKCWKKVINVGNMDVLLSARMQEHVLYLKNKLHFEYVRIWNIIGDQISDGASSNFVCNFVTIDRCIDFLLSNGLKPYIDLEFKPIRINRHAMEWINESEDASKNIEQNDYWRFAGEFASHLANRYRADELESWYFEVAQSQNSRIKMSFDQYKRQYVQMFYSFWNALKGVSPGIKVGAGGLLIQFSMKEDANMLFYWKEENIKPDFITIYSFPYLGISIDGNHYARTATDRHFLMTQIQCARQLLHSCGYTDVPLHVTEWNSTVSQRNILNDHLFKGAYVVKNLIDCMQDVEVIAYWYGSDLIGEAFDVEGFLFGGCGLLTVNGIGKPALYGMIFMDSLQKYIIAKNANGIITTDAANRITIVCHNYKHYSNYYYMNDEDKLKNETIGTLFENQTSVHLDCSISNVKNGFYRVRIVSLNSEAGSIQDELARTGDGTTFLQDEIDYLKHSCRPKLQISNVTVENNVLHISVQMEPQQISMIDMIHIC